MRCTTCNRRVKPVVAIDVDGTLGNYHDHFRQFAQGYTGRTLAEGKGKPVGYPYDQEFSEWLGLEKELYRQIKLAYRQGGMKRTMPPYTGASELMEALHDAGAEVWITTTRPYLRLDNVDPDTRAWLERHRIVYDHIIYDDDKYQRLVTYVGADRVVGVLEDQPELIEAAADLGCQPIMRLTTHSRDTRRDPYAGSLATAQYLLLHRVETWYEATS